MSPLSDGLKSVPISKTPTGILGLDEILLGGYPQGRTTLLSGGPGTGKTVMGLEFLYKGALAGEPGLFVTFEETEEAIRTNARAMGWELESLEKSGKLFILQADVPMDVILSGEFDIGGLLAILEAQKEIISARRIVVDAMDRLLQLFPKRRQQQNQLQTLHQWLREKQLTAILTAKETLDKANKLPILDYLLDCIINLNQRVAGQVMTRRLRVVKYRGSGFLTNEYPYIISTGGIELMPISTTQLYQQPFGPRVSTGNSTLDELIGGGFHKMSTIAIAGSSGTGKTTLVSSFAVAAGARQEKVLYISFEEAEESLVHSMLSPGVDLRPALAEECLKILTVLPESRGVEEHLFNILNVIQTFQPAYLILETISATMRIGSEQAAFDLFVRIAGECKKRGITSIFTNQIRPVRSNSFSNLENISGIGISSLIDTLLLLEQNWKENEYERRLLIVKSRGTSHSHQFHNFAITEQGIQVFEKPSTEESNNLPEEPF